MMMGQNHTSRLLMQQKSRHSGLPCSYGPLIACVGYAYRACTLSAHHLPSTLSAAGFPALWWWGLLLMPGQYWHCITTTVLSLGHCIPISHDDHMSGICCALDHCSVVLCSGHIQQVLHSLQTPVETLTVMSLQFWVEHCHAQ